MPDTFKKGTHSAEMLLYSKRDRKIFKNSISVVVGFGRNTDINDFDLSAFHRWLIGQGYKLRP